MRAFDQALTDEGVIGEDKEEKGDIETIDNSTLNDERGAHGTAKL